MLTALAVTLALFGTPQNAVEEAMRAQALEGFLTFTEPNEGLLTWPYVDTLNLVTTGLGNLIDTGAAHSTDGTPPEEALSLPWTIDGRPASRQEIANDWLAVKHAGASQSGGGSQSGLSRIRLSRDAVKALVAKRLAINEDALRARFPAYDSWPADAQIGINGMAWAMGTGNVTHGFPMFAAAVEGIVPNFARAAVESHISNATQKRNDAHFAFFTSAEYASKNQLDPEAIYTRINPDGSAVATDSAVAVFPVSPPLDPSDVDPTSGLQSGAGAAAYLAPVNFKLSGGAKFAIGVGVVTASALTYHFLKGRF